MKFTTCPNRMASSVLTVLLGNIVNTINEAKLILERRGRNVEQSRKGKLKREKHWSNKQKEREVN